MNALRFASGLLGTIIVVALIVAALAFRSSGKPATAAPIRPIGAGAAAQQPAPNATPAPLQALGQPVEAAKGDDCIGLVTTDDRLTPTSQNVLTASDAALIGTVESVDVLRWDTPDGEAPKGDNLTSASVYRTVTAKVDTGLKGENSGSVKFRVPGGQAGCSVFFVEGMPLDIKSGQTFAFFLQDLPATDAKDARVPTATDIWLVEGSVVQTPENGDVSITELEAEGRAVSQ